MTRPGRPLLIQPKATALRDRIRYWMRAMNITHADLARVWGIHNGAARKKMSSARTGRPIAPDELQAAVELFGLSADDACALHRQAAVEQGWRIG